MRPNEFRLLRSAAPLLLLLSACRVVADDPPAGFESLFDGATLDGWDGDPAVWSVEDGAITGATTTAAPISQNTFLVWEGGQVDNFVLRLRFRIADQGVGNSGVQYRSKRLPGGNRWALGGYQADIEKTNKYMGILYEEKGRGILAMPGEDVVLSAKEGGYAKETVGQVGKREDFFAGVRAGEWQDYEIVADGARLTHTINGALVTRVVDNDTANAAQSGLLALQVHAGPAMRVQFKSIYLKRLPDDR